MSKRVKQVADTIQRILGDVIQSELKDPRVGFATVTAVQVSADLQHARVFISVMGDEQQQKETMQGLKSARGFLRRRVADEMNHLRFVPELRLELDTSLDYSMHIEALLQEVERERLERPEHES
jgi:ribosome-binding factor A